MEFNMIEFKSFYSKAKVEAEKGIPRQDRIGSIFIFIFSILMLLYFGFHLYLSTGFYNLEFNLLEKLFLFGFFVFWIITSGLEGILGLRFLSRLVDVFGGVIFATIAIAWLLVVFPFEFNYFANILPESIRFLIQWISNDIAYVIMILLLILHLFAVFYSPFAYDFVDKNLLSRKKN
jgi:hypothetical protein